MASPTLDHKPYFTDMSYSFFTLPLELRIKVYKMCMMSDVCTEVEMTKTGPKPRFELSSALLRTCRAVYSEAIPELYGSKEFRALMFIDFNMGLRTFSRLARHCIKVIRIDLERCFLVAGDESYCQWANHYFMGNLDEALLSQMTSLKRLDVYSEIPWILYDHISRRESSVQIFAFHEQFLKSLKDAEPIHGQGLYVLMQRLKQRGGTQLRLGLRFRELDIAVGYQCIQETEVFVELELEQYNSKEDTTRKERWVVNKVSENVSLRAASRF